MVRLQDEEVTFILCAIIVPVLGGYRELARRFDYLLYGVLVCFPKTAGRLDLHFWLAFFSATTLKIDIFLQGYSIGFYSFMSMSDLIR